jgi:dipeptidyl aminopeptidase/acylaminoacyl peptidase
MLEPDVYRCAASYAGMSDLPRMIDWTGGYEVERYLLRFTGAKSRNDDALSAISPALHADKVRAPILLMHGRDDTNVPLDQSYYMANALKRAGKPVEFLTFDGADHWLSNGETRLAMLKATVAFLEKNNPPN